MAEEGVDPSLVVEPGDRLDVPGLEGIRGPIGVRMSGEPGILNVVLLFELELELEAVEVEMVDGLWL